MKYIVVIIIKWCIFMMCGLVYDFIVVSLSCWEYYVDDEIIMIIYECLEFIGWFLDDDMNIVWWGECSDVDKMMIIDNNFAL